MAHGEGPDRLGGIEEPRCLEIGSEGLFEDPTVLLRGKLQMLRIVPKAQGDAFHAMIF